jgi:uncharacterized integral membrane protein
MSSDNAADWQAVEEKGSKVTPRLVIAVVAAVIGLILVLQNTETVHATFLFFDGEMSLWLFAIIMLVLGAGLGQLAVVIRRRRRDGEPA